ncbi:MAG TPA: glutamine synthetase family protein [Thermomicrobiales bacterium]|nr:glutamine synthetase family protein [Thermomicrobiales bacterium]
MTEEELLGRLAQDQIDYLWVAFHDYNGRACAKSNPRGSMSSAVRTGMVFAKANLNMDLSDHQVSGATMLADAGDFMAVPDPRSYAQLPRYPRTALTHSYMREPDGSPWDGCPRTRLDTIVGKLAEEGFSVQSALEPEFYLFVRATDGELEPITGSTMYGQRGLSDANEFVVDLLSELAGMGIEVAQFHKEYGRGQYELSLQHGSPIQAVDRYLMFRATLHDIAHKHGMVATMMPKPTADSPGNSLHVHLSLWDAGGGENLTASVEDDISLSQTALWFTGGLLAHAPALTAVGSPSVNSYKRLLPGSWAPANAYWGAGNRSGLIRVPGPGSRRRIEFRSSDNTAQPYLLMCALLAAGLDGIMRQIDPGPAFAGDVGHMSSAEIEREHVSFLPRTLPGALDALEQDELVCAALGPEILKHFLAVKRGELATYNTVVHEWERSMYLELQ